ncbi:hypothetical protein Neosp_000783 [[Neocosmospora] mangrovei]
MALLLATGKDVRSAARLAPGHVQANLIVLPSRYAEDFRMLCVRNPVPCPLLAESATVGRYDAVKSCIQGLGGDDILAPGFDLRTDAPRYMVYKDSRLQKANCSNIMMEWTDDHVAFLIGCSYSFEAELTIAGLPPRHAVLERNVPMYRTTVPLCPSGVFTGGTYVVSMRPYKKQDINRVRRITNRHSNTHGEPIAWGWDAIKTLGISDIDSPEWGAPPLTMDGRRLGEAQDDEVPVFWGCGVTPQEAVMRAGLAGLVMAHAPGHMLVLDATNEDIICRRL